MSEIIKKAEKLFSPELKTVSEENARTFIWRMNPGNEIIGNLVSSLAENLDKFKSKKPLPLNIGSFTSSLWIQKSEASPAKNQVQLIGGELRFIEKSEKGKIVKEYEEDKTDAAVRELAEEGHVYGIVRSMLQPLINYQNSFEHPDYRNQTTKKKSPVRVLKQNKLFSAQSPSFLIPQSFIESDNIKRILSLSPYQMEILLKDNSLYLKEFGETVLLADSLSSDPTLRAKQKVESDQVVDEQVKRLLLYNAFFNEAQISHLIIGKFISQTFSNNHYMMKIFDISPPDSVPVQDLINLNQEDFDSVINSLKSFINKVNGHFARSDNFVSADNFDWDTAEGILT